MKVFLSHKMTGLSDEEVEIIRNDAIDYLTEKYGKIEVIDNYHHDDAPENAGRLWHLGKSISQMSEADVIYFCPGWNTANGCIIEMIICKLYNLIIIG
jgi:hypothetical protein